MLRYTGLLPTIGHDRALGVTAIRVFCKGKFCPPTGGVTLGRLALSPTATVRGHLEGR